MFRILTFCLVIWLTPAWSQVVINELCATNGDIAYDPQFYNFSGWIELYNTQSDVVDVSGYCVSNDANTPCLWSIPSGTTIEPHGFIILWCDKQSIGLHTSFSLRAKGGEVWLSTPSETRIDHVSYPVQYTNVSYGRTVDGGGIFSYFGAPTLRGKNAYGNAATSPADPPVFSVKAGMYTSEQSVALTIVEASGVIRYTTDGSEPRDTSSVYAGPIVVQKTTSLKAKVWADGKLPSHTVTHTYILENRSFTLPVVSLSTDPAYLFDTHVGIAVSGSNGLPGNCEEHPHNYNQPWERHGVFEYFDPRGDRVFQQAVDVSIAGGCSRRYPQKSMAVKARNKYGDNAFEGYRFFDMKPLYRFHDLMLRNGGTDFRQTQFRDVLMQEIIRDQLDLDYQAYQPVIVYRNGAYYGIMNLREKMDADYLKSNYGYDEDEIDLVELDGRPIRGSNVAYETYVHGLQQLDRSTAEAFTYIDNHIDVQAYIHYLVAQIYYANTDWPRNNVKYWRHRDGGKFRWLLYDTDFGFSNLYHNTFHYVTDSTQTHGPNPAWSTLHMRLVLENPIFRARFIQTFSTALSTTFDPTRVNGIIDFMQQRYAAEKPYHFERWNHTTMEQWNQHVLGLKSFASERHTFMREYLSSFFRVGQAVLLNVAGTPSVASGFSINGVELVGDRQEIQTYPQLPYTVKAIPQPGYRFVQWHVTKRAHDVIALIPNAAAWRYFDQGSMPDGIWWNGSYDDHAWATGSAPLGYGAEDITTEVSYGADASQKYPTTYFRKDFDVEDISNVAALTADMVYADGAIVYVNGLEVFKGNMPMGSAMYETYALAPGATQVVHRFQIPRSVLQHGNNVLVVEVHRRNAHGATLLFDMALNALMLRDTLTYTTTDPIVADTIISPVTLQAYFEPVERLSGLVINEVVASNTEQKDEHGDAEDFIEVYNTTAKAIDLAGLFVTDKKSNKFRYQIPVDKGAETIIPAHGYQVLWGDQEVYEGPLHLPFKLSALGESVGIYQKVGEDVFMVDEVTFPSIETNHSMSRVPNGTGAFHITHRMTPGASNLLDAPLRSEHHAPAAVHVFPNPTTGHVYVQTPQIMHRLSVLNAQGQVVRSYDTHTTVVDMMDLPSGVYVVVVHLHDQRILKRFVKL